MHDSLDTTVTRQAVRPFLSHMHRRGETPAARCSRNSDRSRERHISGSIGVRVRKPENTCDTQYFKLSQNQKYPALTVLLSEWIRTSYLGRRFQEAISIVSITRSVDILDFIDQATICRGNRSRTVARYKKPSWVRIPDQGCH